MSFYALSWWLCKERRQKTRLCSAPETQRERPTLSTPSSHSLLSYFLPALKGHFVDICWGVCVGGLSSSIKVTHFLVIWYNNRKTAFSFTWKGQRGEAKGRQGGFGLRDGGASCGKGNAVENRQQCCYLHSQMHPVIKAEDEDWWQRGAMW